MMDWEKFKEYLKIIDADGSIDENRALQMAKLEVLKYPYNKAYDADVYALAIVYKTMHEMTMADRLKSGAITDAELSGKVSSVKEGDISVTYRESSSSTTKTTTMTAYGREFEELMNQLMNGIVPVIISDYEGI